MKHQNYFNIKFQEPIEKQIYDPPSNELEEYYDFEFNFKRFFYENNHLIVLEIGVEKINLHFYHDVLDAFEDGLCKQISLLSIGKKASVDFNGTRVDFIPTEKQDEIICRIGITGTGKYNYHTLYLSQVVEKMSDFINHVLNMAIQKNYITIENISRLVEWQCHS